MSTQAFDMAQDSAGFRRRLKRILYIFLVLVFAFLFISTYTILSGTPYMRDWRGITCIIFTIMLSVVYAIATILSGRKWPMPWPYALSLWLTFYLLVLLLTLIDPEFFWDFCIAFGISFMILRSFHLLLAVGVIIVTIFAFQGLLTWPLQEGMLSGIVGQSMAFFSMTAFSMILQYMISEHFERNRLFQQLMQANAELEEAHRRLAQSAEQEQELAVLRERTRLAREMHDTLGHTLVLISVKLEAAQRLRERDPERCERELESTKEIARESMTTLRASIANLRSSVLEHEHIYHALKCAANELAQRTDVRVTYTFQIGDEDLPEPIVETLWKVSREILTNIEKHAHASHVDLHVSQHDSNLLLRVHDNGIGLPAALCQFSENGRIICQSPSGHYGLSGMRERVESVGGFIILYSSKEQGTTVEVTLPLMVDYQL